MKFFKDHLKIFKLESSIQAIKKDIWCFVINCNFWSQTKIFKHNKQGCIAFQYVKQSFWARKKKSHFMVNRSFFQNIHFCQICLFIVAYLANFKRNSIEWIQTTRCTRFWDKNPFILDERQFLEHIHNCHLCLIIVLYNHAKFRKKSLEWIPRKRCTRFCAQYGIKMSHFRVKKNFFKSFTIVTFVYLL